MVYSLENLTNSTLSNKQSFIALETSLQQSISNLKELVLDFEQLQLESDDYKTQVLSLKGKCESKVCVGSEALKKVIELKDNIIQSVASVLTRLNETKDMKIIDEAFKILCGETITLTPPKDTIDMKLMTPKKEISPSCTEAFNDESVSEIEATPTGRKSPIILSRKARNAAVSDYREKKKCPDNWPSPNTKAVKLTYPPLTTPKGKTGKSKLRQTRFTTVKQTSVIDVTSTPELSGLRGLKDSMSCVQLTTKKESFDDEDTIEPSPTSITSNFSSFASSQPLLGSAGRLRADFSIPRYRSAVRGSPLKLNKNSPNKIAKGSPNKLSLNKKPFSNSSKLLIKTENTAMCNVENVENNLEDPELEIKMEESINLLRPARFQTPERSHAKKKDPDVTECNINSSMSLLQHIKPEVTSQGHKKILFSPTKQPLAENINCTNIQTQCDTQASVSVLNKNQAVEGIVKKDLERIASKMVNEPVEAVFKEPAVRKKAEKRALPGWSCDECKNFYAELYKDNPEMLAQKMEECSKHRGRQNPVRPKTPPGFWYPRWDVPDDTEEFNRRNNAV